MAGVNNIDELQDKLDGVYDFNKAGDCRQIITVLLRSVREKEDECRTATDQLKMLALMILSHDPKAAEKARNVLEESMDKKVDVINFLKSMAFAADKVSMLKDEDLVLEVTDKIWDGLEMESRESALLGELIYRMKKLIGVK